MCQCDSPKQHNQRQDQCKEQEQNAEQQVKDENKEGEKREEQQQQQKVEQNLQERLQQSVVGEEKQNMHRVQQRLLNLQHAATCQFINSAGGYCPVSSLCKTMKNLWEHVCHCKHKTCKFDRCASSKFALMHYKKCKDIRCFVCAPVRRKKTNAENSTTTACKRYYQLLNEDSSNAAALDSKTICDGVTPGSVPPAKRTKMEHASLSSSSDNTSSQEDKCCRPKQNEKMNSDYLMTVSLQASLEQNHQRGAGSVEVVFNNDPLMLLHEIHEEEDSMRAARLYKEEDAKTAAKPYDEDLEAQSLKARNRASKDRLAMAATTTGRAWLLVKALWDMYNASKATLPEKCEPVALEDMVYQAERFLETQNRFRQEGKPYNVDLGYHYTTVENMANIRTNGLLSRAERQAMNIHSKFNGACYGEGIYTGNHHTSFKEFGEVGLIVARLPGLVMDVASCGRTYDVHNNNSITARGGNLVVLQHSSQCLPLFRYPRSAIVETDVSWCLRHLKSKLNDIVDEFFNNKKMAESRCHVWGMPFYMV